MSLLDRTIRKLAKATKENGAPEADEKNDRREKFRQVLKKYIAKNNLTVPKILTKLEEARKKANDTQIMVPTAYQVRNWMRAQGNPERYFETFFYLMRIVHLEDGYNHYVNRQDGATVFPSLDKNSERKFLHHFEGATQVWETRLMLPVYPPLPKNGVSEVSRDPYRPELNEMVFNLIQQRKLSVMKVEQINNLDRAIDLLVNLQEFKDSQYIVKLVEYSFWMPYLNFAIFDNASVLAGGYHNSRPSDDPFICYWGRSYFELYIKIWTKLDTRALRFSSESEAYRMDLLIKLLKKIPEAELQINAYDPRIKSEDITVERLNQFVETRRKLLQNYKTRW